MDPFILRMSSLYRNSLCVDRICNMFHIGNFSIPLKNALFLYDVLSCLEFWNLHYKMHRSCLLYHCVYFWYVYTELIDHQTLCHKQNILYLLYLHEHTWYAYLNYLLLQNLFGNNRNEKSGDVHHELLHASWHHQHY